MIKTFTLTIFIVLIFTKLSAQESHVVFQLDEPELPKQTTYSHYNSIRLLDIRKDSNDFGKVQKGMFNKIVPVVITEPFSLQLSRSLNFLTKDNGAGNGELVLMIRHLQFYETVGGSENGFFDFSGVLFGGENGVYRKIKSIDTNVVITGMDVTKKILKMGGRFINKSILNNMYKKGNPDFEMTFAQLPMVDSFEKSRLPLYTNPRLKDGLYYNYATFAMQVPNRTDFDAVINEKGQLRKIQVTNAKGKMVTLTNDGSVYAVVYSGKPYIAGLSKTFYSMQKVDSDFIFTGKASDVLPGDVVMSSYLFGIIGGLMASSKTSMFEMKLDHETGGFRKIKKVEPVKAY